MPSDPELDHKKKIQAQTELIKKKVKKIEIGNHKSRFTRLELSTLKNI